ncbi:MAG TPA: sigma-70 family RNA polymerase sigma factor [Sphingomicrobium sp.]|nr:sigma-70 family RNA polymerase sigma factor [Sphingomicrobium sp.]
MDEASILQRGVESANLSRLLASVASQDAASLKSLYERTSAKLYGIALRLIGDEAEAQDLLQEVYVTVWRKASSFDAKRASAITWLATITRNRAIDRLRARRDPGENLDAARDIADDAPTSLDLLEREDDAVRLRLCLDELEDRARRMIRAAFFDGATYPELAERENVPLPTMKSWVRRGLIRLRGCLEQ